MAVSRSTERSSVSIFTPNSWPPTRPSSWDAIGAVTPRSSVVAYSMDFSRIVVRDAAHSKAVLDLQITFLRLAKKFQVSNFNVTACRANVLLLIYRHLSWTKVRWLSVMSLH